MSGKDEISDIEQLMAEFQASDLRELQVRKGEFEIYLSKDRDAPGIGGGAASAAPAPAAQPPRSAAAPAGAKSGKAAPAAAAGAPASDFDESSLPDGAVLVRAPYLGTFYRSPKPGSAPFVEIGQTVDAETEMCLVEVMKLFTAVRAGCTGKVQDVLAQDGAMVAADQPLFVVVPG